MKRFEFKISILNKDYVDNLIICLARQGYAPYIREEDNVVCITISNEELVELQS